MMPTPHTDASPILAAHSPPSASHPRALACVLCQQRKVKCDRKIPCASCLKARVQCVPSRTAPAKRRRRFPERELLERLRHYEGLLRQNSIKFEPLHPAAAEGVLQSESGSRISVTSGDSPFEGQAPSQPVRDPDSCEDSDEPAFPALRDAVVKTWDQTFEGGNHFLFGLHRKDVQLSSLHPQQAQIFKLWQIYLDNVNPLLLVTHTPTLQARIIDAAGDMTGISPALEALMFSIYCAALMTLGEEECISLFGSAKDDLLSSYRFGCQQALANCGVFRTADRDCLTALFLYLVSIRPATDPRSLSALLAIALRIGQRMGLHSESRCARHSPFEAEMRRRLWWSLITYDFRISEMADHNNVATLKNPLWDCRTPLNVNDLDLRPDMKNPPISHNRPTEALFCVVRSELAEALRDASGTLPALQKKIEDKYLSYYDADIPLHLATRLTMKAHFAKAHVMNYFTNHAGPYLSGKSDAELDIAACHAIDALECDTMLMKSPLTKRYAWFTQFHNPFLAYMFLLQDLRRRPEQQHAERAWQIKSDSYETRFRPQGPGGSDQVLEVWARIVLQAWAARVAVLKRGNRPIEPPRIVLELEEKVAQLNLKIPGRVQKKPNIAMGMDSGDLLTPTATETVNFGLPYGTGQVDYSGIFGDVELKENMESIDWAMMDWTDWNPMNGGVW